MDDVERAWLDDTDWWDKYSHAKPMGEEEYGRDLRKFDTCLIKKSL